MADLGALIRFRKHGVNEKQRALAQLYREAEVVERQKKVIEDQMEREIATARELNMPTAQTSLGLYLEGARKKIRALQTALKKMDVRIQAAQDDIRESFAEMKKIEITQANRDARADAAQKKKEDAELDDIAIERFRRQEEE